MINTGKLLTNRSNRSTNLSRKSVINIGLIREDVIKIDGMLKMRLVLSKVREGIERQNEERLKRKSREEELERDDDRDDDDNRRRDPDPKKKRGRGLIGFLIGGVVAIVGALALRFLPTIFKILGFIKKIAKPLTLVISGAFLALTRFISVFNEKTNQLQGIDKDEIKVSRIERAFGDLSGALDAFVTSLIIGGALSMGMKILRGRNSKTVMRDLKRQETKVRRARRRKPSRSYAEVKRDIDLREFDSLTPEAKLRIRRENISRTLLEAEGREGLFDRTPRVQREDFLGMNKPRRRVRVPDSPIDLLQRQRQRSTRRIMTPVGDQLIDSILKSKSFKKKAAQLQQAGVEVFTETNKNVFSRVVDGMTKFYLRGKDGKLIELEEVTINNRRRLITKKFGQSAGESVSGSGPAGGTFNNKLDKRRFFSIDPESGFQFEDTFSRLNTEKVLSNRQILEGTDLLSAPKIPKISQSLLKQRGGIVKVLSNIGGDAFVQTFKQGLKGSIGVIPILGDIFGFLLDYFVFGEPIGRAAFKAVGSFALSSLIGAVGLALGGPVGAFIGGMIGGIGGDILGGIAYDLFFGKERRTSPKSSATKAVVKGATQSFKQGGFVGPEPSSQPLVNSVDRSNDLRVTASYDKPSAGRVKFIPIPLPIPSKEQPQEEQIAMNNTTTKTRTFAGLYQR